jgi:hypothetical protein
MMRIFSVTLLLCALAGPSVLAAHSNDKAASGTTTDAAKNTRAVSMATATPSMTGPATNTPAASVMTTPVATTANGGNPANGANAAVEGELQQLRELLEAQQAEIAALKERLNGGATGNALAGSSATSGAISASPSANGRASVAAAMPQDQPRNESDSNMSFRIGGVDFRPGGFVDFSNYWRSTNVGSGFGTSFNTIPFNNTSAGGLTEEHITAVNSRLSLTVRSHVAAGDVLGYLETDFNGNQPTNLLVNRNSATLRLRLFFADYRRGNWEILGGQDWTMLTPDRMGIGALPADLFTTLDIDSNNNVGLVSARQPQFRLVYHPTEYWAMGVSVENPDQYTGTAITFPSAFNPSSGTTYTNQVDQGIGTNSPAYFPDIIAKIARDQLVGGKDWHFEVAGLLTSDKLYTPAAVAGVGATQSKTGGGVAANIDLALTHKLHLIANTFWSDGGGRYIYALGPNFVVAQDPNSLNFLPSLVHAGSGLGGFEWQAPRKFQWFAYYGGAYFGRNFSIDPATMKDVGYGYTGSSNSQNRAIQEISTGFTHSFWKSENYGALQLINQVSWVTRAPWYVTPATSSTPGAPKNANAAVVYVDLRYVIP